MVVPSVEPIVSFISHGRLLSHRAGSLAISTWVFNQALFPRSVGLSSRSPRSEEALTSSRTTQHEWNTRLVPLTTREPIEKTRKARFTRRLKDFGMSYFICRLTAFFSPFYGGSPKLRRKQRNYENSPTAFRALPRSLVLHTRSMPWLRT